MKNFLGPIWTGRILQKNFFKFFSLISWGLCTGTNDEKLNFYSLNTLNSPLEPVLSAQEIEAKFKKKSFF
jgi:hypothetical protein